MSRGEAEVGTAAQAASHADDMATRVLTRRLATCSGILQHVWVLTRQRYREAHGRRWGQDRQ
jgi:hypothetical protein